MRRLKCFLGFHDWHYTRAINAKNPDYYACYACLKRKVAS